MLENLAKFGENSVKFWQNSAENLTRGRNAPKFRAKIPSKFEIFDKGGKMCFENSAKFGENSVKFWQNSAENSTKRGENGERA